MSAPEEVTVPQSTPRAFVCFSARDECVGDFARLFWRRLEEQSVDVFRYETFHGEISAGNDLFQSCEIEISRANFFFPILTEASFNSSWCQRELHYALSLCRDHFIFPIILISHDNWPTPYNHLCGMKSLLRLRNFSDLSSSQVEEAIDRSLMQFCADRNWVYFPPIADMPRMPLRQRLLQEIWGQKNLDRSRKAAIVEELFSLCTDFVSAYSSGDLACAGMLINSVIFKAQKEFPSTPLYYPKIVEALIDRERSNSRHEALQHLRSSLQNLIDSDNPWVDANVHALLGNLELDLGNPRSAIRCFEVADQYLSDIDPALVHNIVLAAVLAGDSALLGQLHETLAAVLDGANVCRERDFYRLRLVHALVCILCGHGRTAIYRLHELCPIDEADFDLIRQLMDMASNIARQHKDRALIASVYGLLEAMEQVTDRYSPVVWVSIIHRKAWTGLEMGRYRDATQAIDRILQHEEFSQSFKLLVDGCLIYLAAGERAAAVSCLHRARSVTTSQNPSALMSSHESEYYSGLALWLEGRDDIARHYYYEKPGSSESGPWYGDAFPWVDRTLLHLT